MLPDIFFSPSFSFMSLLTKTSYKNRSFTTRQGFEYSLSLHCFLLCPVPALLGRGSGEKADKVTPTHSRLFRRLDRECAFRSDPGSLSLLFACMLYLYLPLDGTIGLQSVCESFFFFFSAAQPHGYSPLICETLPGHFNVFF